ncbi:methenyltetrahydrofolate synthase domain-containing protein isoform X2 [Peromyscus californicus insignis]|uniref:methenyltetrahydrofolate synthase domain-containing protein isoform X2 n=1 Tax=Peromyscus californicus insignis TaxID=564181 RepID=UPI0022A7971A|nr:methenyltetrahydrofolate synthase domain-containing protein isoform X2 [Peromyscus californicus insignis]
MEALTGVSKQGIREQIWDYMESHDLADFPRPVHHRIPNFKGASCAAEHFPHLHAFSVARTIKVNPDAPQRNARFLVLESKKTLLVPTPRLRTGLFNKITPPPGATKDILRKCATSQGVRNFSVPVSLDSSVLVDLIVVGSVAVSEKGWRIGKGEGYADLEYAMMVSMGAVHEGTPVVTIVHDCQVVDIPEALLEDHDLTVDYIITPTRVIATGCTRPKPTGIIWSKVSCEMLTKIPVLRSLREREKRAGKDVALQAEPGSQCPGPSTIRRARDIPQSHAGALGRSHSPLQGVDTQLAATVRVENLPYDARVRELKRALQELGAVPLRLTWQGPQHRAILHYADSAAAQQAASRLQGLHLGANTLRVALGQQRDT